METPRPRIPDPRPRPGRKTERLSRLPLRGPPEARVPVEDWTAVLTGRLDGCIEREPGHWLIEELKSTNLSVDGVRPSGYAFERDRRQLLAYCYLWKRLGHLRVSGALVYVDIETGEELSLQVPYDEDTDREIERRLARALGTWRAEKVVRLRKARAAERLPFPHTAPRPVQEKIIEAVRAAVRDGENLLAEAPTGSGKTAAALHPALAEGLSSGRQVVFLTSKTLQQKMAVSSLVAMNERAFHTVQVRAKDRMCANDRILCHEDFCRFAKGYPEKMERSNLLGRLRDSYAHFDPDTVFEEARREEVCPFEVQLELAERADAIVADYNYVFEPAAALRHLTGEDLREVDPPDRRGPQPARPRAADLLARDPRRRPRDASQPAGVAARRALRRHRRRGRGPRRDPRERGRGTAGRRGDRRDRASERRDPRAASGLGVLPDALPRVETRDAPRARR